MWKRISSLNFYVNEKKKNVSSSLIIIRIISSVEQTSERQNFRRLRRRRRRNYWTHVMIEVRGSEQLLHSISWTNWPNSLLTSDGERKRERETWTNRIRLRILYLHCLVNETKLSVEKKSDNAAKDESREGPQRRWKSSVCRVSRAHWHLMPIRIEEKESESCRVRIRTSS